MTTTLKAISEIALLSLSILSTSCFEKPQVVIVPPGEVFQVGPDGGVANSVIVKIDGKKQLIERKTVIPPGYYIVPPPTTQPQ